MFNYNHLFYFYTTAKVGTVTNAAKALKVAQPSLSIQLKTLEQELSLTLFKKVGRKLQLTPAGERVFEFCRKIFEAAEELDDYLKYSQGVSIERCRIGVAPEIERPFVADVLSSLLHKFSGKIRPHLTLISSGHKDLLNRLVAGDIDVVVTDQNVHGPNVKTLASLSMPILAVTHPRHHKGLYKSSDPFTKNLKKEQTELVLPSENLKLRLEADLFMQKHKLRNPVVFESDILSVIVRAVTEGVGIGFLPKHYIQKELKEKKLLALNRGDALWETKLFVLARKQKKMDPTVELIKDHFYKLAQL